MLKKEELYTQEVNEMKINTINTEENRGKILLILNLFFMIVVVSYLIYMNLQDSNTLSTKTKVMGVSYIVDETDTINNGVKYNHTDKSRLTGIKGNDQDQYDDVVVVDDKKEYTDMVVVKKTGY